MFGLGMGLKARRGHLERSSVRNSDGLSYLDFFNALLAGFTARSLKTWSRVDNLAVDGKRDRLAMDSSYNVESRNKGAGGGGRKLEEHSNRREEVSQPLPADTNSITSTRHRNNPDSAELYLPAPSYEWEVGLRWDRQDLTP